MSTPAPEEMMHEVGAYDPLDAKKILTELEARGIPFEVESDHSELTRPGRMALMVFGMYPPARSSRSSFRHPPSSGRRPSSPSFSRCD